jgi:dienelactone hydrolase
MMKWLKRFLLVCVVVVVVFAVWLRDVIFYSEPSLDEWVTEMRPHVYARHYDDSPAPVIFLMHGCGGQKPWLREQRLEFYSQQGFYTVAIDSFGARDVDVKKVCNGSQLWAGQRLVDLAAAIRIVGEDPRAQVEQYAVVGYSHGAWAALEIYSDRWDAFEELIKPPSAIVAYYPFCEWPNRATESWTRGIPLRAFLAEADTITRVEPCELLFRENRSQAMIEFEVFSGVEHGFDVPDTEEWPNHYDAEADQAAKHSTVEFLRRHLLGIQE